MTESSKLWGEVHQHQRHPLFPVQHASFVRNQGFFLTVTRQTLKRDHSEGKTDTKKVPNKWITEQQQADTYQDSLG